MKTLAIAFLLTMASAKWAEPHRGKQFQCSKCAQGKPNLLGMPDDSGKSFSQKVVDSCDGDKAKQVTEGHGSALVAWKPKEEDKNLCPSDADNCIMAMKATIGGCDAQSQVFSLRSKRQMAKMEDFWTLLVLASAWIRCSARAHFRN